MAHSRSPAARSPKSPRRAGTSAVLPAARAVRHVVVDFGGQAHQLQDQLQDLLLTRVSAMVNSRSGATQVAEGVQPPAADPGWVASGGPCGCVLGAVGDQDGVSGPRLGSAASAASARRGLSRAGRWTVSLTDMAWSPFGSLVSRRASSAGRIQARSRTARSGLAPRGEPGPSRTGWSRTTPWPRATGPPREPARAPGRVREAGQHGGRELGE